MLRSRQQNEQKPKKIGDKNRKTLYNLLDNAVYGKKSKKNITEWFT